MSKSYPAFSITSNQEFEEVSLRTFHFQYHNNKIYRKFCNLNGCGPEKVNSVKEIPFLPIEFFKEFSVTSTEKAPEIIFTSSGTTSAQTSKHFVPDLQLYKESFRRSFQKFYGNIEEYAVLALLPSYLERTGSSLIFMVEDFIQNSKNKHSGFYLNELDSLRKTLIELDEKGQKTLLIGVSFALLDLVEKYRFQLKNTVVMETGGMKGRRKELVREELHQILCEGFGISEIHSEYGMTELLSQAYSKGKGIFECPPWMRLIIRDPEDPLSFLPEGKTGGINVIDLANYYSCSFIATQDLGKAIPGSKYEILGRFDNSDIRGCNLMVL